MLKLPKLASLFSLLLVTALLTSQRALADEDDPPGRVGRLSYMSGSVSFQPAGTEDWVNAVVNRPITTGDKLWADSDSRAELHIGSASIRLNSNTGFSFLNLTDENTQIQLTSGTLRIRVKRLDDNENLEVDTPNLAFSILRTGVYQIRVNEDGNSTVIRVHNGEGEVTGGGSAYNIHPHEIGTFNGNDQLNADIESSADDEDEFEAWCSDRDRHEDLSISSRYVSPDVIGYQDLDDAGGWRPVPDYGYVWFPHTTIVGWAPYRYGHWAYVSPWGYTWIDDASWGFAPFHYGRWIYYNNAWGWVPCPPPRPNVVYVRPVYAPALVAWVGGEHFGVGVAVGGGAAINVGWFPLGPREVFVPSYHVSHNYITNVNVSNTTVNTTIINNYYNTTVVNRNTTVVNNNVTEIHQTYINQGVAGAVTATTGRAFTTAQPIAKNVVRVDNREVAGAPVSSFTPSVAPVKQAVLGSGAVARAKPPAAIESRAVVAKVAPPPPPISFARQEQAIQANGGRPLAVSQVKQIQTESAPAQHMVKVAPPPVHQTPQGNPARQNSAGARTAPPNPEANVGSNGGQGGGGKTFTPSGAGPAAGPSNPVNNARSYNDRPPSARPPSAAAGPANNSQANLQRQQQQQQLDMKHQQQLETLRNQQDQERQKLEQQQVQERQKVAQQAADQARQQQLVQKHEQQLQALEQKHDSEQQKLEQKQQAERQKSAPPPSHKEDKADHHK